MSHKKHILIVGTCDTKSEELLFIKERIEQAGAIGLVMDVGVLGEPIFKPNYSKHDVATWAKTSNQAVIDLGNEHKAMIKQAQGASALSVHLAETGEIDGLIAIGGTMATDLALEVTAALPFGFPKMIVSTISFSALIAPDRLAPDVMMSLWTAGLYGLNPYCETVLNQAAYAIVGAAKAAIKKPIKPVIAISSLGTSSLKYIKKLYPALQQMGFDVAIFHTTGMGGRSMEAINQSDGFAAILDFSLIEVSNKEFGSIVHSGDMRLQGHPEDKTPRMIAAGGVTLIDFQAHGEPPIDQKGREKHTHNRLLTCLALSADERKQAATAIAKKVNALAAPKTVFLTQGIDEWDKQGGPFHDKKGLEGFNKTLFDRLNKGTHVLQLNAHINDQAFVDAVLNNLKDWIKTGVVAPSY